MLQKLRKVGGVVLVVFVGLTVISAVLPRINDIYIPLYGTDPEIFGISRPSLQHPMGTDFMGRDVFSQLCSGAYFAMLHGIHMSIIGIPLLVVVALILAGLRSRTPIGDTFATRYIRFVIFPLSITLLYALLSYILAARFMGRLPWAAMLLFSPAFILLAWLAVGHELEKMFRERKKIPGRLLLSGVFLIFSYTAIYESILGLMGTDPTMVNWGWMLHEYLEYGAPFWQVILPIVCIYVFSRGMLALSYSLYNTGEKEKYFFKESWF